MRIIINLNLFKKSTTFPLCVDRTPHQMAAHSKRKTPDPVGGFFMETIRLLLPFTGNINTLALNYAIQFAEMRGATLVPLALIRVMPGKAVRLERVQQAQDFLEFVHYKAQRQGVPVEQARIYTNDAV